MTAHPQQCPITGELHFFGYGIVPPLLTYHRADAAGNLVQSEVIEVPGPTMIHDFAITRRHVIFMDLPVVFDLERLADGTMPFRWSDDHGARVGVMPRGGGNVDVRWFDVDPCYAFHTLNAFDHDDTGRVSVDIARYPEFWRDSTHVFPDAHLHRWTVDLDSGKVVEEPFDDRPAEFPRVDPRRVGLRHRYGYSVQGVSECITRESAANALATYQATALVKSDMHSGVCEGHRFPAGQIAGEGVFVPSGEGTAEDEGWLLSYVYDGPRDASDLVILDASNLAAPPMATISLPQRVPFGFHGSWVADSGLRA